jgi:hypothetical protein
LRTSSGISLPTYVEGERRDGGKEGGKVGGGRKIRMEEEGRRERRMGKVGRREGRKGKEEGRRIRGKK